MTPQRAIALLDRLNIALVVVWLLMVAAGLGLLAAAWLPAP